MIQTINKTYAVILFFGIDFFHEGCISARN